MKKRYQIISKICYKKKISKFIRIENNIQLIFLSFTREKNWFKNKDYIILFNYIFLEKSFLKKINVFLHDIFLDLKFLSLI